MRKRKRVRTGRLESRSPGKSIRTGPTREAFLEQLRLGRSWQGACDEVEVSRSAMYKWYRDAEDPSFKEDCDDAMEGGTDRLEDEARRRGARGYRKAVYHQGRVVGFERVYSDRLLENILAARRPEKWGRQRVEMSGPGGKPIEQNTTVTRLTLEELREEAAKRGLPTRIFEE